eukprot:SAG11_NODE_37616_length_256_cov_0.649682_1_plen_38_part_10
MFLVLLGLAISTSFFGGGLSTVDSFYDDNWDEIKDDIQ